MAAQKDPELIFSHEYNRSTTTYETIPSGKDLKGIWTAPPQQRNKRTISRQAGEVEMQPNKKPHSGCSNPQAGEIKIWNLSLRINGLCPISGMPTLGNFTGRANSPKLLTLKTNRAYFQKICRGIENGKSTCRGLVHRPTFPRPSTKATVWKAPRPYVEGTHLC